MLKHYFVYMLANKPNGTIYIGITNNVQKRTAEHKYNVINGFTKKYGVHKLVYYEIYTDINAAIAREKQLKWWRRNWKIDLIIQKNPGWNDLFTNKF